jgi:hypothetical protein
MKISFFDEYIFDEDIYIYHAADIENKIGDGPINTYIQEP